MRADASQTRVARSLRGDPGATKTRACELHPIPLASSLLPHPSPAHPFPHPIPHASSSLVRRLGCGSGAAGLAAALLGARSTWLTDIDVHALELAQRNAVRNGLGSAAVAFAELDFIAPASDSTPPPAMPLSFGVVICADVLYSNVEGAWIETLAAVSRFVDKDDRDARVLCTFGRDQNRSETAKRSVEQFEMALSAHGGAAHGAGLRLVAREAVIEVGHDEPALIMLLLAPDSLRNSGPDPLSMIQKNG